MQFSSKGSETINFSVAIRDFDGVRERGKANAHAIVEDETGGVALRVHRVDVVTTARPL